MSLSERGARPARGSIGFSGGWVEEQGGNGKVRGRGTYQIHQNDSTGTRQIEARAACLQRSEEDAGTGVGFEFLDDGGAAVDAGGAGELETGPGFELADFGQDA